jgi:tetratricopeptide (TPR) repeat protein
MMGRFDEAIHFVNKAKAIDPLTVAYFNYETISLYLLGRYEEAINVLKEALQLYPSVLRLYDYLGRTYLTLGKYEEAVESNTVWTSRRQDQTSINDCIPGRGIRGSTRRG